MRNQRKKIKKMEYLLKKINDFNNILKIDNLNWLE